MRPQFRETLETYGEIAKDMKKAASQKELGELATVLDWNMGKEAEHRGTSRDTQFKIFDTQQKKQEVMAWLKLEIQKLDHPEAKPERPPGTIFLTQENGKYLRRWTTESGKKKKQAVTLGEIFTDGDWGLRYHLDPETVPRNVRKEFLIEEAKRRLQSYLDDQILVEEVSSNRTDAGRRNAYEALKAERASGKEAGGHALERMVRNFFRKLEIDHSLPLTVEYTDVFQDVEQKIDFIFRRPKRVRGVGVQESEQASDVAVQFTKDDRPETLERKRRQLRSARGRIDEDEDAVADIILVAMPTAAGSGTVNHWKKEGSRSGGPDGTWDGALREKVFRTLLKGFMSPAEIDAHWAKISLKDEAPETKG